MESFVITDAIFKDIRHKDAPERLDFEMSVLASDGVRMGMTANSRKNVIFGFAGRQFSGSFSRKPDKKRMYSKAELSPIDGHPIPKESTAPTVGGVLHGHFKLPAKAQLQLHVSEIPETFGATLLVEIHHPLLSIPQSAPTPPPETSNIEALFSSAGAGFGDPENNKLVEAAAIEYVTAQYKGWAVQNRTKDNLGYDLECIRGTEIRHVEVKGVSGGREEFIITRNEAAKAESDPHFVLAVVINARSELRTHREYPGPEMLERFDLTPIAYRAKPKKPAK